MTSRTFTKTPAPDWLLAFWREIDDKTWGKGFDCFKEDAVANLGVSDWHWRAWMRGIHRRWLTGTDLSARLLSRSRQRQRSGYLISTLRIHELGKYCVQIEEQDSGE